ncbi:MAG: hypothetical protein IT488_09480 [Gammaproteobacteria bacterium]|nr:hypothetical protein [Gammaproteobacteria bacterium]
MSRIARMDGAVYVRFSHACIHKSGRNGGARWSQEAVLVLEDASLLDAMPLLPASITDGFLEVGGIRHEIIPLPFKRKVGARLFLMFTDGARIEIAGNRPHIELLGNKIYLDDIP